MTQQRGAVAGPAVLNVPPDADEWGLVVRLIGGVIVVGPIIVDQGTTPWIVDQERPAISVVSTVAVDALPVLLLASNPARQGAMIWNDSNQRLYVKLGLGASTGNFTVRLDGQSYYELPFPAYTGDITAVRAAGPASPVQATELT